MIKVLCVTISSSNSSKRHQAFATKLCWCTLATTRFEVIFRLTLSPRPRSRVSNTTLVALAVVLVVAVDVVELNTVASSAPVLLVAATASALLATYIEGPRRL